MIRLRLEKFHRSLNRYRSISLSRAVSLSLGRFDVSSQRSLWCGFTQVLVDTIPLDRCKAIREVADNDDTADCKYMCNVL